jgi:hypothetical protein
VHSTGGSMIMSPARQDDKSLPAICGSFSVGNRTVPEESLELENSDSAEDITLCRTSTALMLD